MNRRLINIQELSELTDLSTSTIYSWVSQRRIPFIKCLFLVIIETTKGYFMNANKGSKKNMDQALDVCLEFVSSENSHMRLLQAFDMLMEDNGSSGLTKGVLAVKLGHKKKGGVNK